MGLGNLLFHYGALPFEDSAISPFSYNLEEAIVWHLQSHPSKLLLNGEFLVMSNSDSLRLLLDIRVFHGRGRMQESRCPGRHVCVVGAASYYSRVWGLGVKMPFLKLAKIG